MRQAYKYDNEGNFVEPVLVYPNKDRMYSLPENCTWATPPQPNWKPVFNGVAWVETATEEEKNPPVQEQLSVEQKLELMQKAIDELILGGGL